MLFSCRAGHVHRTQSESPAPRGCGARNPLADGDCILPAAPHGLEIVISHPRFYLGEVGNDNTKPLFTLPIPASRDMVHTGYHFVMPDENGWSRYLHFEAAWLLVFTALVYGLWGLWTGHFRKNLLQGPGERTWRGYRKALGLVLMHYLRRVPPGEATDKGSARRYNVAQRTAYLLVIFVVFPR